jgi:hypothetical protein
MMKNTILVNTDVAVRRFADQMMEYLDDTFDGLHVENLADDLMDLATRLRKLTSLNDSTALQAFRAEFKESIANFVSMDTLKELEKYERTGEEYRIALFRENGTPLGLVFMDSINW